MKHSTRLHPMRVVHAPRTTSHYPPRPDTRILAPARGEYAAAGVSCTRRPDHAQPLHAAPHATPCSTPSSQYAIAHSNFRRSLEDFRLRQVDLGVQFPPLRYSRCSSRKMLARRRVWPFRTYHSKEPSSHVCLRTWKSPSFTAPNPLRLSPHRCDLGAHLVPDRKRPPARPNNGFTGG